MFERFDKKSTALVERAWEEATLLGATRIEAEHLLLALSRHPGWDAGRVLAEVGLDHAGMREALDAGLERSLAAVGVTATAFGLADRPLPPTGQPRMGTSAKRALHCALLVVKARGDRSIQPTHILLGALRAVEGTVPRALAAAGVDRSTLAASAEATLGD